MRVYRRVALDLAVSAIHTVVAERAPDGVQRLTSC
jgi:hypothetical protein